MALALHIRRLLPLLLFTQLTGCALGRMSVLERRLTTLEQQQASSAAGQETQTLRFESVATGLEKLTERLDQNIPPSAQWLKFQKGTAIKWYLDDQAQNVYVQYLEPGLQTDSVLVSISTRARTSQHPMRPGEAIEHRWTAPVPPRSFIVTFHRLLVVEDGSRWGLFSIIEGPLPGLQ